ncbi:MAG: chromate transporter [Oscillospiraceae bacterium]|nr:chromate transporter [Oscillospiraceae bacterium]
MILLRLFYEFFLTGLFMFGGGLASIPFLKQMSENTGWFTLEELLDMVAISESTPGPISVNIATYAGFMAAGIPGGIVATAGLLLPSLIIASVVARLLSRFRNNTMVSATFYGLRPASLGLIAAAGLIVLRHSLLNEELWSHTGRPLDLFDVRALLFAAVLFILVNRLKFHPILFLAGSAVVGILIF